jgi:diguanylate cyclase (GGDEF)-like protein
VEERVLSAALAGRLGRVEALLNSAKAMNAVLELDEVLDVILRSALELLDGRDGSIMLAQGEDTLRTVCARGTSAARGATVAFGRGVAGRVAESREGVVVNGVLDPARWQAPGLPPAPLSALCVPLMHRDALLGVMNINANPGRTFTEHDLRALTVFAEQAAGAIANARLYEEQSLLASQNLYHALHDPLTTLPNRALFIDRTDHALARRQRGSRRVALLYIDLDDFKVVNDTYGHDIGDRVLISFGDRLRRSVRSADTVARLGGDEFAVLLEDVAGGAEVAATAERIVASLANPFVVDDTRVFLQACIGIADEVSGGGTALDMLRSADSAMNAGKRTGKGRITTFDVALHPVSTRRPDLERELEDAVVGGQLSVAYQPIFDLTDNTVVGSRDGTVPPAAPSSPVRFSPTRSAPASSPPSTAGCCAGRPRRWPPCPPTVISARDWRCT